MFFAVAPIRAQVTGNVTSRVFQIRFAGKTGTAFVIDHEDRQYFVTAEHMVAAAGERAKIDVFGQGDAEWHTLEFAILHGELPCADVAVLKPTEKQFLKADAIPYPSGFFFGQEVYFLGFPYGLYSSWGKDAIALQKHAYISASVSCKSIYPNGSADERLLLLDGLNNPGFSGGPVVARDMMEGTRLFKVLGVISGYKNEILALKVDGHDAVNASVAANSGIIIAVPMQRVVELLEKGGPKK
jgi:S1-C subfamily serine protease